MPDTVLSASNLEEAGLRLFKRGKVRDVYELDADTLLLVATDRISAFDCMLAPPIPEKGRILTEISEYWFPRLEGIVPNHVRKAKPSAWPALVERFGEDLAYRSLVVSRADVVPVECVVRGYLTGSAWREYREHGTVNGELLPPGLERFARLPAPLFCPTTKAHIGHDVPLSPAALVELVGADLAQRLEDAAISIFSYAQSLAEKARLVLVDTKFEFGYVNGVFTLVDEVLTPDSSRFWPAESYVAGEGGVHWDKEYVRAYLESTPWAKTDRTVPPPPLPHKVVEELRRRYAALRDRLLEAD
ncbi:MAG: phosphoribosylaminoimidazolesuccinocarboxamide synthase [Candidatus Schekmanbacteria bacterium]|nr:phosphoribosylaminoimidazolesuccinocarboxamide synthase [Candidatus Schekmanbacteria bacterium]